MKLITGIVLTILLSSCYKVDKRKCKGKPVIQKIQPKKAWKQLLPKLKYDICKAEYIPCIGCRSEFIVYDQLTKSKVVLYIDELNRYKVWK